jgi:twitching motility protein PilU
MLSPAASAATYSYKLDDLLTRTAELEGSDLYLAAEARPSVLVHGVLQEIGEDFLTPGTMMEMARQATSESQMAEFLQNLEINIARKVGPWRFRLNVYYQRGTAAMVARLIKPNILSVGQLGLPEVLNGIVMNERGIVLVTGATGSGKSTTLAAMIDYRNQNSTGHIVTIEDPIEFVHDH